MLSGERYREEYTGEEHIVKRQKTKESIPQEPIHGKRPLLKARLTWKVKNHTEQAYGSFLFDTGCTGAVLSADFV